MTVVFISHCHFLFHRFESVSCRIGYPAFIFDFENKKFKNKGKV